MNGKIKKKGLFRVGVYLNEGELTAMGKEAEKLKFRRAGIPLKTQKPHGFADEWIANTDGISKYLKYCHKYYVEHEAERLQKLAELLERERKIQEEKNKLGG